MANGAVITNGGLSNLEQRWYNTSSVTAPSRIRVGTGTTTPLASDTALTTDLGSVGYINYSSTAIDAPNNKIICTAVLGLSVGNGSTISECGEFNTDSTPVMTSHDVFTGIAKTNTKILALTITHQGSTV